MPLCNNHGDICIQYTYIHVVYINIVPYGNNNSDDDDDDGIGIVIVITM